MAERYAEWSWKHDDSVRWSTSIKHNGKGEVSGKRRDGTSRTVHMTREMRHAGPCVNGEAIEVKAPFYARILPLKVPAETCSTIDLFLLTFTYIPISRFARLNELDCPFRDNRSMVPLLVFTSQSRVSRT